MINISIQKVQDVNYHTSKPMTFRILPRNTCTQTAIKIFCVNEISYFEQHVRHQIGGAHVTLNYPQNSKGDSIF